VGGRKGTIEGKDAERNLEADEDVDRGKRAAERSRTSLLAVGAVRVSTRVEKETENMD